MITYRSGNWKYQLIDAVEFKIPEFVLLVDGVSTGHISLEDGILRIAAGYSWDGASGPVIDRDSTKRASLAHDALYQLMRADLVDREEWKRPADRVFRRLCIEDGVWKWLAKAYCMGLDAFGRTATLRDQRRPVMTAP